ncbi:hypothetical protein D7Z94_01040 [Ulvibacterium marinum]|uniref:Uncharacterized protein n=1 Tax=Ulvibacterium marinum TaxID=2419782 RepID=A0A3B0CCZ8_9FLAO|nr:hypothetical protein D7Z94_01040 [Ulvibacterium marinum]
MARRQVSIPCLPTGRYPLSPPLAGRLRGQFIKSAKIKLFLGVLKIGSNLFNIDFVLFQWIKEYSYHFFT